MKTLTTAQLKTKLTSIANSHSEEALSNVLAHCIHNGLVHHNIMPEHMKLVRESEVTGKFKAALAKYMPMTWNKEKGAYQFSNKKAETLRLQLGLEFRNSTVEDVLLVLPNIFAKKERKVNEFSIDTYTTAMATKLAKEGVADAELIAQLVNMLAKDSGGISAAVKAVVNAQVSEEVQAEAV